MDPRVSRRFARNLRRCRQRAGLSPGELNRLAELHRGHVGKLEGGRRLPRLDTILKVAAALEGSPCKLFAGLRWAPGHYVEGGFEVEAPEPAAPDGEDR